MLEWLKKLFSATKDRPRVADTRTPANGALAQDEMTEQSIAHKNTGDAHLNQGRFEEAEGIARQELSTDQAEANVAYLKSMLAQQNSWSKLKDKDAAAQSASAQ